MKYLIVLVALFAFTYALPQPQEKENFLECSLCHALAPKLENFADKEAELGEDYLKKECDKISFLSHLCDDFLKKHVDPILAVLRADECKSGCFACAEIVKCSGDHCQPSCGRPSCTGCSDRK